MQPSICNLQLCVARAYQRLVHMQPGLGVAQAICRRTVFKMAKANGVSSAFKNNLQNAFNSNWNKAGMRNETYCDRAVCIYIYICIRYTRYSLKCSHSPHAMALRAPGRTCAHFMRTTNERELSRDEMKHTIDMCRGVSRRNEHFIPHEYLIFAEEIPLATVLFEVHFDALGTQRHTQTLTWTHKYKSLMRILYAFKLKGVDGNECVWSQAGK